MTASPWEAVAAPGTDPERVAALVAALRAPRGAVGALGRRLRRWLELGDAPDPSVALDRLLGVPTLPDPAVLDAAQAWLAHGVRVCLLGDPGYPERLLRAWPDPAVPLLLASQGDPRPLDRSPTVAIVGARRATPYGTGVAAWIAQACASAGVNVVSGGAVGIDAAAHEAAADGRGGTTVVLGCGHAARYPRAHALPGGLFDRVRAGGGIVCSEQLPTAPPHPGVVRARNRIVAGLADAVVVVEGGGRSGALITAGAAADLGVPVLAVPGDVRAPGSVAPHRLLAEGAAPATCPRDVLDAVAAGIEEPVDDGEPAGATTVLPAPVHAVLAERWPRPIHLDDLAGASGMAAGVLLAAVTQARVAGELSDGPEGLRLIRAPARERVDPP